MNNNKFFIWIVSILFAILFIWAGVISFVVFSNRTQIEKVEYVIPPFERKIFIPELPSKLDFCSEEVPLNFIDVRERLERELIINAHWNSSTILFLKRANRWFPIIEPILKKNRIPNDFKYLAVIESNLSNVVSPASAVGFWQLTKPAAEKYGLEVNDNVDERYNIEKATQAACDYLNDAHARYGNWTMAAASYNYGLNGIDRQIDRQRTHSYYDLYLNEETYRFIPRILAIKMIYENPEKFGFFLLPDDLYPEVESKQVIIKSGINDLADFATKNGINYKILKICNPWLRDNFLKNKFKKQYVIKIPTDSNFLPSD